MFRLTSGSRRLCQGPPRREFLRVGGASLLGLGLPDWLRSEAQAVDKARQTQGAKTLPLPGSRVKSVILFFLEGGPAHQDLWDMKPDAPLGVRSEFKPIATTVPGLNFCEHLPRLAKQAHHLTFVRSVHHSIADHNAGAYFALTGREPVSSGRLVTTPEPDNFPPFGAVLAKLRPSGRALPDFVQIPDWMSNNGSFLPGQDAGFLGSSFNPFLSGDPSLPGYKVPGLTPPREVPMERVGRRLALLEELDHTLEPGPALDSRDAHYRKAFALIRSVEAREAFDLSKEPASVRERYGFDRDNPRTKEARQFGGLPHLGQSLLLARRLVEAGVRLVTVCTGARYDQTWDTHRQHYPLLKNSILPMFDQAFSALLEDLHNRRMLDETLVIAMGEFGRTPKIGQITSSAGADAGGRDHWPHCYSALFAGGGFPAGTIYGASDPHAAYPAKDAVTPQDLTATIYQRLGIAPETEIRDALGRPFALSTGRVIAGLA